MFCTQQKKLSTILYYSPIAYRAFKGQEFKGKGALCLASFLPPGIPCSDTIWSWQAYCHQLFPARTLYGPGKFPTTSYSPLGHWLPERKKDSIDRLGETEIWCGLQQGGLCGCKSAEIRYFSLKKKLQSIYIPY